MTLISPPRYHVSKCRWSGLWLVSFDGKELCAHKEWAKAMNCAWIDVSIHPLMRDY